ncbi:hypothetical protein BGZ94_004914 [Podila epigama]|nr:hypothetical protein BGZ94_004914 [Podila epigama]
MLAQPGHEEKKKTVKEENIFKQAWHSVEEALHLRSDVPPPVPEKDERWKVKTVNKAVPLGQATPEVQAEPGFWDSLFHRKSRSSSSAQSDDDDDDYVSVSVPADAALKQLGVESDDKDIEEKKNYFKRMAIRVQQKFDDDSDDDSDDDTDDEGQKPAVPPKTEEEKLEKQRRKKLAPKVDPKEMKAAHKAIYNTRDDDDDDEADKKTFGSWWGCHPRRTWAERKLAKEREAEAERQRVLDELAAKKKAEEEAAAAAAAAAKRKWWRFGSSQTPEEIAKEKAAKEKAIRQKERKETTHKRQAIASAAAYEAVKEYQVREAKKTGKKTSHGEMKAILAGMAMAEAVKLLSKDDDDDEEGKDETVADAGSKVLKLFELMN